MPDLQSGAIATRHTSPNIWCHRRESNSQPPDYKSVALPIVLRWHMVGKMGFEPMTPRSQSVCTTKLYYFPIYGVKYENRTRITGATVQRFTIKLTSPSGGQCWIRTNNQSVMSRQLCL